MGTAHQARTSAHGKGGNYAARVVTRKRKFDHISRAKRALGWLSFEHTIDFRDCVFVHALLHEANAPAHLKGLVALRADVSERSTRATAADLLHVPRTRLERTRMATPVPSLSIWNKLDRETRSSGSGSAFKKRAKSFYLSKQ